MSASICDICGQPLRDGHPCYHTSGELASNMRELRKELAEAQGLHCATETDLVAAQTQNHILASDNAVLYRALSLLLTEMDEESPDYERRCERYGIAKEAIGRFHPGPEYVQQQRQEAQEELALEIAEAAALPTGWGKAIHDIIFRVLKSRLPEGMEPTNVATLNDPEVLEDITKIVKEHDQWRKNSEAVDFEMGKGDCNDSGS